MKKVKYGYKMTELGEIPIEWEIKKLKELGKSLIGLTYSPDDLVDEGNGTLVLRSSNIRDNRIVFDDNKYVNKDIQEKLIVKENDILICSRNGSKDLIGKCALIDKKAEGSSFGAFMTIYRSKYNKYLFNVFASYMFKRQIYNNLGATINQITTDNLNNFKVILPTIKEQEKIASILSTVDEQIDNIDELIQKNKELKKGLMQQLLTKGIGHTKFKKTEIGEIPEEWEVKKISELCNIVSGGTPSTKEYSYWDNGEILWATPTDITSNGKYISDTFSRITEEGLKNSSANMLPIGSILMSSRATIGERCINKVPMCTNQGFKSFICKENLHNEYMYYLIEIIKNDFISLSSGSTFLELSKSAIERFNIAVPGIGEQKEIASILSEVDEKIEEYENKKQKLEELKKGLMQQLLTGKIRV
ncbi:restriction endonuclease subunit S [uncultured Clostridium sp.]|uniref:restriction endonuclease subunit S n=1 Tax=uncultured Clostridium sp. TaxID=59620 RepID=UPI002584540F|nr:restriction endonuclease subunit S [uncultured Clostridium sp.]